MIADVTSSPIGRRQLIARLSAKPEFGAAVGALAVLTFFATQSAPFRSADGIANWLDASATVGIMTVPIALLMIGGHFDLSAASQTATAALTTGIMTTYWGLHLWASLAASLLLTLCIGLVNGWLVLRTGLPSLIVTLATYLGLQGLNIGFTKAVTGTVEVDNVDLTPGFDPLHRLMGGTLHIAGADFQVVIVWWLAITAVGSWTLTRTRFGNWIVATGGDARAGEVAGVPTRRTTIRLFMLCSLAAWFAGNAQLMRFGSARAQEGIGQELLYIGAAVIGGCLLSGGYGSLRGASLGALIFGMTQTGIIYLNGDSDWFKLFVGIVLLLAVLTNQLVRHLAERTRWGGIP